MDKNALFAMPFPRPLNRSTPQRSPLIQVIRDEIGVHGPITFARFMEQALYHPEHGYYSSGRCAIGRHGDFFTSVSVGPLFGQMLAAQFAEIWDTLDRPNDFVIVEQGSHHGELAMDVLEAARARSPDFFGALRYRIVEPFPVLQRRQEGVLRPFAAKTEWRGSLQEMEPFCGVHFSNELLDALPVHLLCAAGDRGARQWHERFVDWTSRGFAFVARPLSDVRLQARLATIPPAPPGGYETEISLATLDWIEALAPKLRRGVVLVADYGLTRPDFYKPSRTAGTLQSYAQHRALRSPLEDVGESDMSTHVEWTSLAERAEECGLRVAGFTDQHHFLTGLLASHPDLLSAGGEKSRALQTLLHPEFLGVKFQVLALTRDFPGSIGGFKFAREARPALGLD